MSTDWNPRRSWSNKSDWKPKSDATSFKSDWKRTSDWKPKSDWEGTNLAETLQRLQSKPKRGKGRLPPAAPRDGLPESVAESVPTGASPGDTSGSGIVSPLAEQAYAGATFYSLTSSDGLFVFEYPASTEYVDDDGFGASIIVKHLAP